MFGSPRIKKNDSRFWKARFIISLALKFCQIHTWLQGYFLVVTLKYKNNLSQRFLLNRILRSSDFPLITLAYPSLLYIQCHLPLCHLYPYPYVENHYPSWFWNGSDLWSQLLLIGYRSICEVPVGRLSPTVLIAGHPFISVCSLAISCLISPLLVPW